MKKKDLLATIDTSAIEAAIARAEARTSGEICVHIEPSVGRYDPMEYAQRTFERLGMTRTAERNGVLIFIAASEQKFVVLGDRGIHEHVGSDFWEAVAGAMTAAFREGRFTDGLVTAIERAGERLADHFPHRPDDVNELPDGVSIGEGDDAE